MFRDIKMSEQRMQDFRKSTVSQQLSVDLWVKVLTTGHWPNESRDPSAWKQANNAIETVSLPLEIKQCMSVYKQYYMSKFNGR
jgi:hypothetical protein